MAFTFDDKADTLTETSPYSFVDTPSKMVPPLQASPITEQINFALEDLSPGMDSIFQDVIGGRTEQLAESMANLEVVRHNSMKQQRVFDFASKAKEAGTPIDNSEFENLLTKGDAELADLVSNPQSYFDKKRAKTTLESIVPQEAQPSEQDGLAMKKYLAKQYGFQRILQETQTRVDNESFLSTVVNTAEQFVPVFSWWNMADAVKKAPTSSFLLGNNILEQSQYLLNKDNVDEAISEAQTAIDDIYKANPQDALAFAQALVSYGNSDANLTNAFQVVNMATGVVAGVAGTGLKNFLRAASKPNATIPGMLDATGQQAAAGLADVQTRLRQAADGSGARPQSFNEIEGEINSFFNPSTATQGTTRHSPEFMQRFVDTLSNQSEALANSALDATSVTRLRPGTQAFTEAITQTVDRFNIQYPGIQNHVSSIGYINSADNALANTDNLVVNLSRNTGQAFGADYEAEAIAKLYGLKGYTIQQQGSGYFIQLTKAVDETLPSVRDALTIDTAADPTPNQITNKFMGWFRSKDSLLPGEINQELKTTAFGAQQLSQLSASIMEQSFKELPKWRNDSRRTFTRFVEAQRDFIDPVTGQRGRFANTVTDFDTQWQAATSRLPTEQETLAYFTYKNVNDAEWMLRNLNIYKGKQRLGVENFHFKKDGIKLKIDAPIEGRIRTLDDLFRSEEDAGVLVWNDTRTGAHTMLRKRIGSNRAQIADLVNNQGYRIVQLSDFGEDAIRQYPLNNLIPQGRVNYVLVKKYESTPLSLRQIPYRPGGHVEYADNFFVSQPIVRAHTFEGQTTNDYYGDRTALAFRTQAQANQYTQAFNAARELRAAGRDADLRQFLSTTRILPYSYTEFTRLFDPARGGIFDVNTPMYARSRGGRVHDEHKLDRVYDNFTDNRSSSHNMFNEDVNMQYAMERGENLDTIENVGTHNNPQLNLRPARLVDPMVTVERSARGIARGKYLDDLKIKSSERFVAEFADVLKGDFEELQRYPMKALFGDTLNKEHPNKEMLSAAKNYRRAMREFLTVKNEDDKWANTIMNRLATQAYRTLGEARGNAVLDWIEPALASTIADPSRFFRQIAFYPRMGFWNPKQLLLQGSGVVHTAAIEGIDRAMKGSGAATLMRGLHLRGNSAILDRAAKMAVKGGMYNNVDHFKESYLALQRSGFQNVGGEYGTMDDFLNPRIVRGGGSKVLESGLTFFRAGERSNRLTAWNAGYMRWRDANPLARFDSNAQKEVLARADLLTMNMTRASNASFNQGISSIPTQFFSYQARLMDQMLGGRLSVREKGRIMATYSLLYGAPLGVAGTYAGVLWPWHEEARKQAMEAGIDVNDVGWDAFLNGIPQAALNYLSDGEVNPAISGTFGPNGLSFFRDFMTGDKTPQELLTGAAGTTVGALYSTVGGLMEAGLAQLEPTLAGDYAMITDDPRYLPLTLEDFKPILENISTLKQADKAYYAYTVGKYFTKNGMDVVDKGKDNPWNAFMTGFMGVDPQPVADYYTKTRLNRSIEATMQTAGKDAQEFIRMSYQEGLSDTDRIRYKKKAKAVMEAAGMTENQKYLVYTRAMTGNALTRVQRIDEELKSANKERIDAYINSIRKGE